MPRNAKKIQRRKANATAAQTSKKEEEPTPSTSSEPQFLTYIPKDVYDYLTQYFEEKYGKDVWTTGIRTNPELDSEDDGFPEREADENRKPCRNSDSGISAGVSFDTPSPAQEAAALTPDTQPSTHPMKSNRKSLVSKEKPATRKDIVHQFGGKLTLEDIVMSRGHANDPKAEGISVSEGNMSQDDGNSSALGGSKGAYSTKNWPCFIPKSDFYYGLEKSFLNSQSKSQRKDCTGDGGPEVMHFYVRLNGLKEKEDFLEHVITLDKDDKAIIFCDNTDTAMSICTKLQHKGLRPQILSEDLSKTDKRLVLDMFRMGKVCRLLISTDVLRNSDSALDSAKMVVNFDLPVTSAVYIKRAEFAYSFAPEEKADSDAELSHRTVISFTSSDEEVAHVKEIEGELDYSIEAVEEYEHP